LIRLIGFALVVLVAFSLMASSFFTTINFQSMGFQVAEVGLLSLAIMLSMLTGGIDLSIVSVASVAALVAAQLFKTVGAESAVGGVALLETVGFIALGLLAGVMCGVLNGLLITRLRITPILATLGTMQLINGIAIIWTGGRAVYGMPDAFLNLGAGKVALVPIPVLILLGAAFLTAVFVNRTGMGLRLKLVGANAVAARYSGLNNDRVLMMTYVASALLASTAGIVIAARSASANADYGASYLLLTIVIVMLGGVNPNGGYGTVSGVVLSAFTLQMVSSGFNQVGWNAFMYQIAQGVILIGVIGISVLSPSLRLGDRVPWLRARRRATAAAGEAGSTQRPGGSPPAGGPSREEAHTDPHP
jgi:simple sugar transport system permease protein